MLYHSVGLRFDLRLEFRPHWELRALSLLGWEVELAGVGFGSARLEDLSERAEYLVHLGIKLDNLIAGNCLLQGSALVLLHYLGEEGCIDRVDDVEDELTIALSHGVVREVLLYLDVVGNDLCQPLLGCVLVLRHIDGIDFKRVKDLLVAFKHLDHELGRAHALEGEVQLSCTQVKKMSS